MSILMSLNQHYVAHSNMAYSVVALISTGLPCFVPLSRVTQTVSSVDRFIADILATPITILRAESLSFAPDHGLSCAAIWFRPRPSFSRSTDGETAERFLRGETTVSCV